MTEAEAFVENWSKVWRGRDSDPELYMELLHEGCPLINPINPITRADLPGFVEAVLEAEPDIRVVPTRWAETADGSLLMEWLNTGTLHGAPWGSETVWQSISADSVSSTRSARGGGFAGYQGLISRDRIPAARQTNRARLTSTRRIWYRRARVKLQ